MSNKINVVLSVDLNFPLDQIGKERVKEYIKSSVERMQGSLLSPEEKIIDKVYVKEVSVIRSLEEAKSAGGQARAEALSPEERSAIAAKAAQARWGKSKKKRVRERT